MQVAIHTCERCGTRLQILERFLGRTVRCTNCGLEFVATAPTPAAERDDRRESVIAPCPACGVRLKVGAATPGRQIRCPTCDHVFSLGSSGAGVATGSPADEGAAPAPDQSPPEPGPTPRESTRDQGAGTDASRPTGSYTHVCTACGAAMEVHARYFGRVLRCTTCRTQFEAIPPSRDGALASVSDRLSVELDRDPVTPGERARRRRWLAAAAVVAALIGAALWWLGGNREQGFASDLFTVSKSRTEIGVLDRAGDSAVTAALDREMLHEMIAALDAGDDAGFERLRSTPRCIEIDAGTRVRVLERHKRAVEARVRVLEGPWESRIVWVPIDWVK